MYKVSKKVEEFFHMPIPPELWHYTSVSALSGMVSSGKVWATEARFTNDRTEYVFAHGVAVEYLNALHPTDDFTRLGIRDLLKLVDISYNVGVLSPRFADVFVASFSAAEDLKSQWGGYGDDYRGVSIAFDLTSARPSLELDTTVTIAPCIYERIQQEELIQAALSHFMESIETFRNELEENDARRRTWPILQNIFGKGIGEPPFTVRSWTEIRTLLEEGRRKMDRDLFVLTSHCKNRMFHEEHEWRIVLPRSRKKNSALFPIKSREISRGGEFVKVPYIELDLPPFSGRLPITRVMTGPHCDALDVKSILDQGNYSVPITPSQLPLR